MHEKSCLDSGMMSSMPSWAMLTSCYTAHARVACQRHAVERSAKDVGGEAWQGETERLAGNWARRGDAKQLHEVWALVTFATALCKSPFFIGDSIVVLFTCVPVSNASICRAICISIKGFRDLKSSKWQRRGTGEVKFAEKAVIPCMSVFPKVTAYVQKF